MKLPSRRRAKAPIATTRSLGVLRRMQKTREKKLSAIGPVLGGSLVRMPRHNSLYLTDKAEGKTRTMYVPLDRLGEAKRWNRNYKEAKRLLAELSAIQRHILRAEIAAARK